jgi:hypothetical protein
MISIVYFFECGVWLLFIFNHLKFCVSKFKKSEIIF